MSTGPLFPYSSHPKTLTFQPPTYPLYPPALATISGTNLPVGSLNLAQRSWCAYSCQPTFWHILRLSDTLRWHKGFALVEDWASIALCGLCKLWNTPRKWPKNILDHLWRSFEPQPTDFITCSFQCRVFSAVLRVQKPGGSSIHGGQATVCQLSFW